MGSEIERKFLVSGTGWRTLAEPVWIRQGYLSSHPSRVVRVRIAGDRAWLTVKGRNDGASRSEWEFEVPPAEAQQMLDEVCERPVLEKRRFRIPIGPIAWEVDEFLGENSGLVVAEVELAAADQQISKPDWIGEEVTGDPRYFNSNLLTHPFSTWTR
jgi:adenylate cyclase